MTQRFDLSALDWQLTGWHPHFWRNRISMETGIGLHANIGPIPGMVPGSVQASLRAANLLPDWNEGMNSLQCEWVENRHWVYEATLPAAWLAAGSRAILHCEGLDYQGYIYVNGREAGHFIGTFVPHTFDLTDYLHDGDNRLTIVFTEIPDYIGQVHYTSRITEWKARFNYVWDWVPRLVQVGFWDAMRLEMRADDVLESLRLYTAYDAQLGRGQVTLHATAAIAQATALEAVVTGAAGEVVHRQYAIAPEMTCTLDELEVDAWQPNGNGAQPLYTVQVRLLATDGAVLAEETRRVGFRQITWKACAGAPADAEPWICCVNGVDIFLQGANWVPLRPFFADVTEEQYRRQLTLYRDLGFNLLRVWGGAVLEKEIFYQLCDELGLLVWQEFPLSSSGIDNWPPEDPQAIAEMRDIVASYIERRQHHPALLLWCGGNELQGSLDGQKTGTGKPVDYTHPMMAMMRDMVAEFDPTRRFIPTSSSGPRFYASAEDYGKGLHHDVHGPWGMAGPLEQWYQYWDSDDALFRSETGFPSASPAAMIRQFGGALALPANRENTWYLHSAAWWIQWDDYLAEGGAADDLDAYVAWSQQRQALAYAYAARVCKSRFPACGGFMIWMGHDAFPCPISNAVIDYDGTPKPAAFALAEVFTTPAGVALA